MDDTSAKRLGAGLSFLFAGADRPDAAALRKALAVCQAKATITGDQDGTAQIVASGLAFELDGLAGSEPAADPTGLAAVRLYPGHHLSGGIDQAPVIRALLALAAELALAFPVRSIRWHPADSVIDPTLFSRQALAWLAGGASPAPGLTPLASLADGSVVSRGLSHFVGQEIIVRGRPEDADQTTRLAAQVIDRIVETGPLRTLTRLTIEGRVLCAEPAMESRQVLVWAAD